MIRRTFVAAALLAALALPAGAQEAPRTGFPAPESLLERDSIAVAVLRARADDAGFQALLANAWRTLKSRSAFTLPPALLFTLSAMGNGQDEDGLLSFLPAQIVRVDRLGPQGPEPTFAFTVSGWQGLQGLFFSALAAPGGKALPTREHRGQTIVLREGWEDPRKARVLSRVKGTFVSCPTPDRARGVIDLLSKPRSAPPQTSLLYAFQRLDASKDTYGALVNEKGSLMKFVEWTNEVDVERVRQEVGAAELDAAAAHARWMTWEGDVVSDDQVDLRVKFEADTADGAQQIADVLMKARTVLAKYNRAGHFQVGATGKQVDLYFSMIGFRQAVQAYVQNLR